MHLPVPYSGLLRAIGVAILAEVGAGVVFADVLANDATTELALALVLVVFLLDGVVAIIQNNGTFRNGIISFPMSRAAISSGLPPGRKVSASAMSHDAYRTIAIALLSRSWPMRVMSVNVTPSHEA